LEQRQRQGQDIGKPYKDEFFSDFFIRTFYLDKPSEDFIWHRDKRDRVISIISGKGWKLQMDNQMPIDLIQRKVYRIPKETFHRLLKGSNDLIIKVMEK
jgi:hypothetical protein